LDPKRIAHLLDLVGQKFFGQVFISDTDKNRLHQILNEYHIEHTLYDINTQKMI
jgi:hypothetical protein